MKAVWQSLRVSKCPANPTMARSKKPGVSKSKQKMTVSQSAVIDAIDDREKYFLTQLQHIELKLYTEVDEKYNQLKVMIPVKLYNYTIEQIVNGDVPFSEKSSTTFHSTVLSDLTANVTQSKTVTKQKGKRSTSCDDGYTSESTRTTHSGVRANTRQSRSKTKNSSVTSSTSRSLTRSRNAPNSYVTPFNKQPPSSNAGSITPKVKLNTPIFCMRRPKNGEMAWSNQGKYKF